MSFKQSIVNGPSKLRVIDDQTKTSLDYLSQSTRAADSPVKQRSNACSWVIISVVGWTVFATVVLLAFGTKGIQQKIKIVTESRIDPELESAYEIISRAAPKGYNVVLVGHDPLSIGENEGMRANAPWSLNLWKSAANGSDWEPWASEIINSADPLYANIHSIHDLFLSNVPFYLNDTMYNSFSREVQEAIDLWNNVEFRAYINDYYVATFNKNYPEPEGGKVLHKVGLISDEDIETLKTWGYGFPYSPDSPYGMHVYGDNCHGGKTRRISGSNSWAKCPDWFWLSDTEKAVSCHSGTYCCCLKGGTQWQGDKCGSKGCHT